ncbi:MAG: pur operon repressor [Clostridia bacterium]|nr:pur operon repressor [Clostridia bacterium]
MDRIRRNERLAAMTRILVESPNRIFTLGTFCEMFGAAKSTMSEDIDILRSVFAQFKLGQLDTVTGAAGGVRYRPMLAPDEACRAVRELAQTLSAPGRILPGGFLYMADILATPEVVERMGTIIASHFYRSEPDFVLTMETKGIPVAMMTARALGVPMVIVRRDSKVYEGPAVNINYLSGSGGRVETMSLSRRAVKEGQRALIVDDFMRAGGTIRGMVDMMREFSVTVVGVCVLAATAEPTKKRLEGVKSLLVVEEANEDNVLTQVRPSDWLIQAAEKAKLG